MEGETLTEKVTRFYVVGMCVPTLGPRDCELWVRELVSVTLGCCGSLSSLPFDPLCTDRAQWWPEERGSIEFLIESC